MIGREEKLEIVSQREHYVLVLGNVFGMLVEVYHTETGFYAQLDV